MSADIYDRLADALDRLPNGFPRTPSNVEVRMLEKIFTPEDAELAVRLDGKYEPVESIAGRIGTTVKQARTRLMQMVKRGLVWFEKRDGGPRFRLAPFIVGIYEAHLDELDHEFSHLFEAYLLDGGAEGLMSMQPAIHRAVPSISLSKSEWILPYDDVRAIIMSAYNFRVRDCICRRERELVGQRCEFPMQVCLYFSRVERTAKPEDITREEALAILDMSEKVGLVHTVGNEQEGVGYICNCCGCCCAILRGVNEWGLENSVAHANYYAVIDPEECLLCETCVERCQVHAVSRDNEQDAIVVDLDRCIGCGLCVTGCENDAAQLVLKPESEIVHPPLDFADWERQRFENRGVTG